MTTYYDDPQGDWTPAAEWGYSADKVAAEYDWAESAPSVPPPDDPRAGRVYWAGQLRNKTKPISF